MFQQLIAKASADVRRKLEHERPDLAEQIQTSVAEVAGSLQSEFGPASEDHFAAKKAVTARHQLAELNENATLEYTPQPQGRRGGSWAIYVVLIAVGAVKRALTDPEMTSVLTKAQNFE